jgi:ABC-type sugar transport system substrate-binding protein
MSFPYRRLVTCGRLAAIPVVIVAAVTAGVSGASAHSAAPHISKSELAQLKAFVAKAQKAPKWHAPGPAVNAKKALKGKTIVTFPISSEIDACNLKGQQGYLDSEAKALGAKVVPLNTNAGPPSWQANLSTALTEKADAVVMLCGPAASAVAPQLQQLHNAHIPVVDGNYNQIGGNAAFPTTNLSAESGIDTAGGVKTDLAQALVDLKGKPAHVLFLDSPQVAQYAGAQQALKAGIKKWCPKSCTMEKEEDFATQDWGSAKEQQAIATDLQGDSKINAVIVTFDGMSDVIVNVVKSAASSHPGLKLYAWGGGISEIKTVQKNPIFAGDSGPDERWDAYNQLDQVIRLLAHKKPAAVGKEVAPNMFFTKKNAKGFSNGNTYSDKPYSNGAFAKDYKKLWEVSK